MGRQDYEHAIALRTQSDSARHLCARLLRGGTAAFAGGCVRDGASGEAVAAPTDDNGADVDEHAPRQEAEKEPRRPLTVRVEEEELQEAAAEERILRRQPTTERLVVTMDNFIGRLETVVAPLVERAVAGASRPVVVAPRSPEIDVAPAIELAQSAPRQSDSLISDVVSDVFGEAVAEQLLSDSPALRHAALLAVAQQLWTGAHLSRRRAVLTAVEALLARCIADTSADVLHGALRVMRCLPQSTIGHAAPLNVARALEVLLPAVVARAVPATAAREGVDMCAEVASNALAWMCKDPAIGGARVCAHLFSPQPGGAEEADDAVERRLRVLMVALPLAGCAAVSDSAAVASSRGYASGTDIRPVPLGVAVRYICDAHTSRPALRAVALATMQQLRRSIQKKADHAKLRGMLHKFCVPLYAELLAGPTGLTSVAPGAAVPDADVCSALSTRIAAAKAEEAEVRAQLVSVRAQTQRLAAERMRASRASAEEAVANSHPEVQALKQTLASLVRARDLADSRVRALRQSSKRAHKSDLARLERARAIMDDSFAREREALVVKSSAAANKQECYPSRHPQSGGGVTVASPGLRRARCNAWN